MINHLHRAGRRSRRGFSLIELLVVVAIIGMIALVGTPAFLNYMRSFRLRAAASQLSGDLALARQRAITRNRNVYVFFRDGSNALHASFPDVVDYDVVESDESYDTTLASVTPTSFRGGPIEVLQEPTLRVENATFPDEALNAIVAGATTYQYTGQPAVVFLPNGAVRSAGQVRVLQTNASARGTRFKAYDISVSTVGKIDVDGVE